jgi:GT2 family glycosyltransferase
MMDKPVATIGILTWRSRDLLKGLLESIRRNRWEYSYEIVVVDNNSEDDTISMIEKDWPSVRLVRNPVNRGVAPARNQIFRMSEREFVIILDVDTEVHAGSLDALVRTMRAHPDAGIAGPKLVYGDGRLQHSCRPFPSPWNIAIEGAFLRDWFPRSRFVKEYTMEDWDHGELREVDWMYGAALIIRKSVLDQVGHFDEGFFYLYEDIDLCFRVKKSGIKILYDPQAVVTHFLPRERKGIFHERFRIHCRSILRYLLKDYYGLPLRTKTSPNGELKDARESG